MSCLVNRKLKIIAMYLPQYHITPENSEFWGEGVHKNCAVTHLSVKGTEFQMIEEGKIYYTPRK